MVNLNGISFSTFTCSKSTTKIRCKLCSKLRIETSKHCEICHSDVSVVNSVTNFQHAIFGWDIKVNVSKYLTVLGQTMLVKIV